MGIEKLWLSVRESNARAIRCYGKVGFTRIRILGPREFNDGSYQSWFEMAKKL